MNKIQVQNDEFINSTNISNHLNFYVSWNFSQRVIYEFYLVLWTKGDKFVDIFKEDISVKKVL
jgi:hypothetical protein